MAKIEEAGILRPSDEIARRARMPATDGGRVSGVSEIYVWKFYEIMELQLKKSGAVIHLRPGNLVIGVGCNRNTPTSEIEQAVTACLEKAGCSLQSVARVATVSNKASEKGLLSFVRKHGLALDVFSPARLNRVACPTPPSGHVIKAVGSGGVCEPAALLSAGVKRLLCPKQKNGNVTVAIAEIPLERLWEEERGEGVKIK